MANSHLAIGMIFLTQTVVGILGNLSLLCHYIILYFTEYRLRCTDLILKHLIVANFLALFCKGVPQTMAAFGWKLSLGNFGCKLVFCLHRVGRGVSIGSICILSVFLVITISHRNSRWAELKVKAPDYIVPSIFSCWILQVLVNISFPIFITEKSSNKNITSKKDYLYCSAVRHDKITDVLYAALLSVPDVFCLGLMLWASSTMVLTLYRHKQRVQHLRRANISPRHSPESRATKIILLLMSTFAYFYALASIFQVVLALLDNPDWFLVNITAIMTMCFPMVSPFLLKIGDSNVSRLCFAWIRNIKSSNLMKNI
ncbi:PREDICTED: vomeronasal type-1 receptor 4-like [Ceratotherium simum simum]|uniref:Vomeronasal type-1 receptor n=1 Tax=Ceratotherium simum simum TaxID=73337 RepID=A0ABM0I2T9_CERSS|nr:PREDICTED: vomeronasal type-1 receptor 4-like [Ceratotherium simum simum]